MAQKALRPVCTFRAELEQLIVLSIAGRSVCPS